MKILTENDYKILSRVLNPKTKIGLSKTTGVTRKYLMDSTNLSYTKVRVGVNALIEHGFLEIGISKGRERTYYLTEKGVLELSTVAESSININKGDGNYE